MSGRAMRWLLLVVLPLLLALYSVYPPVPVAVQTRRIEKAQARSDEQATRHNVKKGEYYVVSDQVVGRTFLPLALGRRDEVTRRLETREDGTIVEEKTTIAQGRVKLGLDLAGGTELLYQLKPREGERLEKKLAESIEVLKRRIDPANVKEYKIRALENDRILIEVPHATISEVEQLKARLERMGRLEFRLAVPRSADARFLQLYEDAERGRLPEGYVRMYVNGDPEKPYYLVKAGDPEITGDYLDPGSLHATRDDRLRPAVGFQFDAVGMVKFARVTENHINWSLAIVLDGTLKSAPVIMTRIAGPGVISGDFTKEELGNLINILRAGSLPVDLELAQESTVGPQLGRDSIQRSVVALAFASFLVVAFMGGYYLWCGVVADGALVMNVILLMGVMCLLGAALTLPGIAGIALTIGMAVDANILIFERIREESGAGKGLQAALRQGHERAFSAIFDSNITTLLTAAILYAVGMGPVRGFAVTLMIGLSLSFFTAIVVTRLALETLVDRAWLRAFTMLRLVKRSAFRFMRVRPLTYAGSAATLIVGLVAFFGRGSALYDIDFTGGTLVQVSLANPVPIAQVRERLAAGGFPDADIQGIQTARAMGGNWTDFGIRIRGMGADAEKAAASVRERLARAGLVGEGDRVAVASDGRALDLELAKPAKEAQLREALAAGGDPYRLSGIDAVTTPETVSGKEARVHLASAPSPLRERAVWGRALEALAWAGLERTDYAVLKCALREPTGGQAELELTLDKPLQPQLLTVELDKVQFPQVTAEAVGQAGTDFILRADASVERGPAKFAQEFPAGSKLPGVPAATIEGPALTAKLSEAASEQDLRALLAQRGFSDVAVLLLDAPSTGFQLSLSYEPIREKVEAIFADLARPKGEVTFEPLAADTAAADASSLVKMKLDEPMAFADVEHCVREAGVADTADTVVGAANYAADTVVSEVTLKLPADEAGEIQKRIAAAFGKGRAVEKVVGIGPVVAQEIQGRALLAVVLSCVVMVFYLAVRFHAFRFGIAAVIALVHDVCVTAGAVALADWAGVFGNMKIGLPSLAAFLTILGYSVNDTIVVFDRERENMAAQGKKAVTADLIDASVNQTLSRTLLTGLTTLFVVVVMYLRCGPVLEGFAFTFLVGIVVGTYSSIYVASAIVLDWDTLMKGLRKGVKLAFLPVTLPFKLLRLVLGRKG